MAKKRKKKDETPEDLGFKIPKFDEEKFLAEEKRKIKITFITFIFAIFMALICFGFWVLLKNNSLRWWLVLMVGVFNASFLKYIFIRLNIKTEDYGNKEWFKTYSMYFFSWLLILILIVNPPFYDDEPPLIEHQVLPDIQEPGGTVKIIARITDNADKIKKDQIDFTLIYPNGTSSKPDFSFDNNNNIFSYEFNKNGNLSGNEEVYQYWINATDKNNHVAAVHGEFIYTEDAIYLALPSSGDLVRAAQEIKFKVRSDVNRVYYEINNVKINATKEGEYYVTSPKMIGWEKNTNVTIKVYAEVIHYFENLNQPFNNTITDTDSYSFRVSDDPDIGSEETPKIDMPRYKPLVIPGFEVLMLVVSLIVITLIARRSKKKREK